MRENRVFTCPLTRYRLEFIIDKETKSALLNTILCDYAFLKHFIALLRTSIDKLKYDENIVEIKQAVAYKEWDQYLKDQTTFKITNNDIQSQIYDISCSIDDFLQNFAIGMGLDE